MYECNYKIGDLIVEKGADLFNSVKVCKVTDVELVDENSDMWDIDFDTEPYWFITTEILYYVKENAHDLTRQIGDSECFEEWEIEPFEKYMNREFTIQDYIDLKYNGKLFYDDEEDM